jgi:hypothetical protein
VPPTSMDILKVNVTAFKEVLDSTKPAEKKKPVSFAFAEDFNRLLAQAKQTDPAMAEHLPEPIKFFNDGWGTTRVQQVDYIHIEIMLNRIIGVIRLFEVKD